MDDSDDFDFDSIIRLEEQFFEQGRADGVIQGEQQGFRDGALTGYQAGFSAGEELGYMVTFLNLCIQSPVERDRAKELLQQLDAQLDQCVASLQLRRQRQPAGDDDDGGVALETEQLLQWARAQQAEHHQAAFSEFSSSMQRSRVLLAKICVRLRLSRNTGGPRAAFQTGATSENSLSF